MKILVYKKYFPISGNKKYKFAKKKKSIRKISSKITPVDLSREKMRNRGWKGGDTKIGETRITATNDRY